MRTEPGTFFCVPNFAADVLPDLGAAAVKVYLYLCRWADGNTGECFRSQKTIGDGCGISERTCRIALTELSEAGLIESKNRGPTSNLYTIKPAESCQLITGRNLPDKQLTGRIASNNRQDSAAYQDLLSKQEPSCPGQAPDEASSAKVKKPKPPAFSPGDMTAAEWIWERISTTFPETRKPNLDRWANDVRLMREQDKRTHRRILEVFKWAHADEFWRANILSPGTLRKQFDKLAAKMTTGAISTPEPTYKDLSEVRF